ncbi:MAG: hypothetical protein RLY21_434 [Planctomycetota bacterium]|jgi:uncharacterized RDD family membrane protein YckC
MVPRALSVLTASLLAALALLSPLMLARDVRAAPPGTLRSSAAGDGHIWWAVRRATPEVPGRSRATAEPAYLLMHHASVEPAPTERFVLQLPSAPEAMAAEGNTVVLVTRPEGERKRLALLIRAQRNQAVGHWYSEPRTGPKILTPLDGSGEVVDLALVDGTIYAVRVVRDEPAGDGGAAPSARARFELSALVAEAGSEWTTEALPPLDAGDGANAPLWTLFRDGTVLCALGTVDGRPTIARLEGGEWRTEPVPVGQGSMPFGAFALGGRLVLVERVQTIPAADGGAPSRIALTLVRQGLRSAWAQFDEPSRPWLVTAFGSDAMLLELDESERGTARAIPPSANAPMPPVTLMPPGFASGTWIHLPIIGAVSLAFMMAAMMFGSDAYLKARLGPSAVPARPRGAPLSRRMLAFALDAAPAFVVCAAIFGGDPQRLFDHPILSPNIAASLPAVLALAGGWLIGAVGDTFFGRSFGKRVLGLVILGRDGQPARMGVRLVRSLLSIIAVFSPPVMLMAFFHPFGDGPAEMLSGAAVVTVEDWKALSEASKPDDGAG